MIKKTLLLFLIASIMLLSILNANSKAQENNPVSGNFENDGDNLEIKPVLGEESNAPVSAEKTEDLNQNESSDEESNENVERVVLENSTYEEIEDLEKKEDLTNKTDNQTEEGIPDNESSPDYISIPLEDITRENPASSAQDSNNSGSISQISPNNSSFINASEENLNEKEKTYFILSSQNGRKPELSGKVPVDFDISGIEKIERVNENGNKEIIIRSGAHLEEPLIAFADIPKISEQEKTKIRVYWVNEQKEIETFSFIDEDNDGMYERVSWAVPHLSEQIFEIIINFSAINTSPELELKTNSVPLGWANNPLSFNFDINYSNLTDLTCYLKLESSSFQRIEYLDLTDDSSSLEYNLPNGNYSWGLNCSDSNRGVSQNKSGLFNINENFSISTNYETYLPNETVSLSVISKGNSSVQIFHNNGSLAYSDSFITSGPYTKILGPFNPGIYEIDLKTDYFVGPSYFKKNFSVISTALSFDKTSAKTNENLNANVIISSPVKKIFSIIMDFGDGNISYDNNVNSNSINLAFSHSYKNPGAYNAKLTFILEGRTIPFELNKNGIIIENSKDNEKPVVTLIEPEDGEVIEFDKLSFRYKVSDNVKIDNCTFEVYNYSDGWGALDYTEVHKNLDNNTEKEIKLQNFVEGKYTWNVYCCDNSSNCNSYFEYENDLRIKLSNQTLVSVKNNEITKTNASYEEKQEIEELISKIESFIEKEKDFSLDEKEVLEDLEISQDVRFYQKRLLQIDQDLSYNIDFLSDSDLREKRKTELLAELEDIKNKTPLDIKIIQKHEYVKNSLVQNLEEIIKDYLAYKQENIDNPKIKKMTELNYNIQSYLTVSTNIKQVEISYAEGKKEITLVTKKVDLKNSSFETLLESIPKEVSENASEITFVNENKIIKQDPLVEIDVTNFNNGKIIYYFEKFIDPKKIEKTDTVLFKEFQIDDLGITGLAIFDFNKELSVYYSLLIIFIVIAIYLITFFIQKIKWHNWKKEENVLRILHLIKEGKKNIGEKDINTAKEKYHKMREIYPLIPEACKKKIYKEIKIMRVAIDKSEIFGLVKEYEEAKKQKRGEDAALFYKDIQLIYKRLPKKYQKAIYKKIVNQKTDI